MTETERPPMPPSRDAWVRAWVTFFPGRERDAEAIWDTLVLPPDHYSISIASWWGDWVARQRKRHKRIA